MPQHTTKHTPHKAPPIDTSEYDDPFDSDQTNLKNPPQNNIYNTNLTLTRWQKAKIRLKTSFEMIIGFIFIIYGGHTALCLLIFVLQTLMFREIVNIGARRRIEKNLPGFNYLHWYWFLCTLFFMYGRALMLHIVTIGFVRHNLKPLLSHHIFISFILFVSGFLWFVISLKKGFYRYQFKQLGWCFLTILLIVVQSTFIMVNILNGIVWFIFPVILIITNDSCAWFFGLLFGKTPLIKLSPKKTWEGFIGGTFSTVLMSFVYAYFLQKYPFFVCQKTGFDFEPVFCQPDAMFVPYERHIWPNLVLLIEKFGFFHIKSFYLSSFQIHAFVLSLFASIIAPFGGFFASGFKRAFRIKDFGDSIPGHGGITDRMDCQILMGLFVYVYITAFLRFVNIDVGYVYALFQMLNSEEKMIFIEKIKSLGYDSNHSI